jgi:hypothetical protein
MATKKITLNELRTLVKQIIKEEEDDYENYSDVNGKYYKSFKKEIEKIGRKREVKINNQRKTFMGGGTLQIGSAIFAATTPYEDDFEGEFYAPMTIYPSNLNAEILINTFNKNK